MGCLCICLAAACSDDGDGASAQDACTSNEQCADDEVCFEAKCVVTGQSYCGSDDDCPAGPYECIDNTCQRQTFDAGADSDPANNGAPDTGDEDANADSGGDGEAPRVVSVTPADGASGVDVDTTIEITFSEPMDPYTINFYSVMLRDANNRDVETEVVYDEPSRTATLTPTEPLRPASGYRIRAESYARDEDRNGLSPEFSATFHTAFDEPAEHAAIAKKFSPVIYQGIADTQGAGPNADIPTRIDFDQNLTAADNAASAMNAQTRTKAHVYYHVSEAADYYFVHYLLYYPLRQMDAGEAPAEHDFAGAVFVIDKASEELLLVEGVTLAQSGELTSGYKPQGSPISLPGGGLGDRSLDTFDPATLEDGTHYPMYVPAGDHETCNWHHSGSAGRCLHEPGQFRGAPDMGAVMRAQDVAQTFEEATLDDDTGRHEMGYALVPFVEGVWAYRGSYASDGLFEVPFVYDALGDERPEGFDTEHAHVLPRRLQSDATTSYGRPPFFWLPSAGESNYGQWLLDPVYVMPNRYNFGQSVSTQYCYNSFFAIDRRGDAGVDGCGDQ